MMTMASAGSRPERFILTSREVGMRNPSIRKTMSLVDTRSKRKVWKSSARFNRCTNSPYWLTSMGWSSALGSLGAAAGSAAAGASAMASAMASTTRAGVSAATDST